MKKCLRTFIPKALGIIFLKHSLDQIFEIKMPEKIKLQKKVFCKLGSVLQTGHDYKAICEYLFVCLYGHLCVCDLVSL